MSNNSQRHEAEPFAEWFSEHTGRQYSVVDGPNPPDFLLQSNSDQTWLEVTAIYLSNKQAEFLNSPNIQTFSSCNSLDETTLRFINQFNRKLSKNSYRSMFEKHGKGILLLTCEDFGFDDVNLPSVQKFLDCPPSYFPADDQGFFGKVYFGYCLLGEGPHYKLVYSDGTVIA